MTAGKDEDLSDLIRSRTEMEWDKLKAKIPAMSTKELVELMVELKLYVNRNLALEIAKREDAVFYLRKMIQDGMHWRSDGPGEGWSPIHAIHILALIKSREALELLLDIIRYHEDDLSDWLTENVSSLLVAFGEDAIESLKEFTEDETLESFARSTATTALKVLAKKFPQHENDIKLHLIELLKSTGDDTFAGLVADDLTSFHDPSVIPEIHRAFEMGRIDEMVIREEEIIDTINGVYHDIDESEFKRYTEDPLNHFSREEIEYLHNLHYAKPEKKHIEPAEAKPKKKKIGRNEPCPCGSGKKYKKCCMGKEKS
ncbi:DUF1186 domain-containing protein [Candidatus Methanoperedens nitratireducens]|uniref:SEC-C motif domain protein n=1 Tax=Candidatus Methanoperedens nitratireducens TaxID=1392998 RepID=A0A284VT17_9EURY|nr:DUF1186 domain-containing protein [Candidatus Methanoperedens nitroreducens]SNQ62431.1 hypothetical protein MNV_710007 [Candidatus Methanoperedens nitroreducens]